MSGLGGASRCSRRTGTFVRLLVAIAAVVCVASSGAATSGSAKVDRKAPTRLTQLRAVPVGSTAMSLTWQASKDAGGSVSYAVSVDSVSVGMTVETEFLATGLDCERRYGFEVRPFDSSGNYAPPTSVSATTGPCSDSQPPTAPTGVVQLERTASSITIAWAKATDNVGVVAYDLYRDGELVGQTSQSSYIFGGLGCAWTYGLSVAARDAAGNTSEPATVLMTTAACPDLSPPSAPVDLGQTEALETSISLAWQPATDDVGVVGYDVYRDGEAVASTAQTSEKIVGLACGKSYAVAVAARDEAGNRSAPTQALMATAACSEPPPEDTEPPSQPSNQRISETTATTITMTWEPAADNVAVTGYNVYLDGAYVATTSELSFTYTGLTCATTYTVALEARDAAGNLSDRRYATGPAVTAPCSSPTETDTTPPSQPSNQRIPETTTTTITMTWEPAADNVAVTGYNVYLDGAYVATTSELSFTYSGLDCATTYTVALEARDAAGNVSDKRYATGPATTKACGGDTSAPTAPTGLSVASATASTITLSWSAAADDVAVAGYGIYDGDTKLAEVGATARTHQVAGLECGSTHSLAVDAFDAAGNRSARASLLAATNPCPDSAAPTTPTGLRITATTETSVAIRWDASTDDFGVTGYWVYLGGVKVGSASSTSYALDGLTCDSTYTVAVDAHDAAGNRSEKTSLIVSTSVCPTDTEPPSQPSNQRIAETTATTVKMTWEAATDNVGVTGYNVYLDGTKVATTQELSYTYSDLTCATTYTVALEARDAAGNVSDRRYATGPATTSVCEQAPAPPPPPPADNSTASLFLSPNGADAGTCTAAAPCASFQRAYQLAAPGAVVEVAAGTYPNQLLKAVAGKASPNVVFRPASGARVILHGLEFGTSTASEGPKYITVRDMELSYVDPDHQRGISVRVGAGQIRLENMDAGNLTTWFSNGVTVLGGDYGPCRAPANGCWLNNIDVSDNVLIDGATFHDYNYLPACVQSGDCHWRSIYINGGRNVTVRNSTIRNSVFAPWTTISGPDAAARGNENILIENNQFGIPVQSPMTSGWQNAWCQNGGQPSYRNVTVRFNSFARGTGADFPGWYSSEFGCRVQNFAVYGNIFGSRPECPTEQRQTVGVSYHHNVYTGSRAGTCGTGDVNIGGATMPFYAKDTQAPAPGDFALSASFAGENLVPSSAGCPATDAAGRARGADGACDAGAFER